MKINFFVNGEPFNFFDKEARIHRVGHLIQQCKNSNIEYKVWTSNFYHQKKKFFSEKDKNFEIIKSIGYKKNISILRIIDNFLLGIKIYFKLKKGNYKNDIFICSFPIPEVCFAVSLFCKKRGIPIIIDLRDLWPQVFYNLYQNKIINIIIKIIFFYQEIMNGFIFKNATSIFSITDTFLGYGLKYAKRKICKNDSIFYLAHSKPTFYEKEDIKINYNIPEDKIIICFFGVINIKKFDFLTLLKAIKNHNTNKFHFIICGDGDDSNIFDKEINNVTYLGWLNQKQISYIARNSHFGLAHYKPTIDFCSSIPNKIIEYFSYGLPIIHSLKGDTYNLLNNNHINYYYEYGDIDNFNLLLNKLSKGHKSKNINKINKIFANEFNSNIVYKNYLNKVYEIHKKKI
tara:strand:- start:8123 stop:9325 length:1203 start_codon:yes stop_codon:yes gene_type:complete